MTQLPFIQQYNYSESYCEIVYFLVHRVIMLNNVKFGPDQKRLTCYLSAAGNNMIMPRKQCPDWIDRGTRGCPVPKGVLLAGSTVRATATRINIVEIGYEGDPVQIYLPHPVYAQAMVYDEDTKLLTVAGGIRFTDQPQDIVPNPCRQVWQLELFTEDSRWESLPDLEEGVYDPVLLSKGGTLYVMGGYTNLPRAATKEDPEPEPTPTDGTRRCQVLGTEDKKWTYIQDLDAPIDAPFGGAGVITIVTRQRAYKYDMANNTWTPKDYSTIIFKCTPAVGPDNIISAVAYYYDGKHRMAGILNYDFATNSWTPGRNDFDFDASDVVYGAGRLLSLQLLPVDLAMKLIVN